MRYFTTVLFITSVLTLIGCGNSAEDYMNEASENLKNNKTSEAVAAYQKLIDEYPESEQAPEALYQLATIYQGVLLPDLTREESMNKSIESFKKIFEKYPQNKYAPVSLFMSGFVQANELQNYDEATKAYNLFLQKYPDHELAKSAKEELDNMGLSPEDILKKAETLN
jgi:TolA-binding protein